MVSANTIKLLPSNRTHFRLLRLIKLHLSTLVTSRSVCASAFCLSVCASLHLLVLLLVCLSAYLSVCLVICLSACVTACLPICLPVVLLVCLSVILLVCLSVCGPACLPVCVPARVSVCLWSCLSVCESGGLFNTTGEQETAGDGCYSLRTKWRPPAQSAETPAVFLRPELR